MLNYWIMLAFAAIAGATVLVLAVQGRGAAAQRARMRQSYFDLCLPLFGDVRRGVANHGFARISGTRDGRPFDLQALPDTLTFRKLPSLWLMVTIPAPTGLRATLDLMARPTGTEVFSHFAQLPVHLSTPDGLPDDVAVRTDDPARLPDRTFLDESILPLLQRLFARERMKELVLSPKGLRIVWLAEEADRTRYLLYRDAEMGQVPLQPALLNVLVDDLTELANRLATLQPGD